MMPLLAALLLAGETTSPRPARAPELPGWMTGCWEQRTGERWTEECWSSPRGAMMIGYSRSGEGGSLAEWELMQIVHAQSDDRAMPRLTFTALPSGQNRTTFNWVPANEPGLSFVNLETDYPKRIRYWREGAELVAEIALGDGSKARRWRFKPVAMPTRRPPPSPRAPSARDR